MIGFASGDHPDDPGQPRAAEEHRHRRPALGRLPPARSGEDPAGDGGAVRDVRARRGAPVVSSTYPLRGRCQGAARRSRRGAASARWCWFPETRRPRPPCRIAREARSGGTPWRRAAPAGGYWHGGRGRRASAAGHLVTGRVGACAAVGDAAALLVRRLAVVGGARVGLRVGAARPVHRPVGAPVHRAGAGCGARAPLTAPPLWYWRCRRPSAKTLRRARRWRRRGP